MIKGKTTGENSRDQSNPASFISQQHFFDQKIREEVKKVRNFPHRDPSVIFDLRTGEIHIWNPLEKRHLDVMAELKVDETLCVRGFVEKKGDYEGAGIDSINFFTPRVNIEQGQTIEVVRGNLKKIVTALKTSSLDPETRIAIIKSSYDEADGWVNVSPEKLFPDKKKLNEIAIETTLKKF